MSAGTVPASEALELLEYAAGLVADLDAAEMPAETLGECVQGVEGVEAVLAAAIGRLLAAYDAKDGHLADGQRTLRAWLVNTMGVTKGQAAQYRALVKLALDHAVLCSALRTKALVKSVALQLAQWTQNIPAEFRRQTEEILVAAAQAGARLHELAAIYAEIRSRTAPPDPDDDKDPRLDRGLSLDLTMDGAGVLRGDLTPECAAMVTAVLDALSTPQPGGDLRTQPQRYHDALEEAMRRLLASNLLPARAGQPTKALVHIGLPDLIQLDTDSVLQDTWIAAYRARWAAHRAAASVTPGDGGAWLEGDAARAVACDAMLIPVVLCDIDPGPIEQLITYCVEYDRLRAHAHAHAGDSGDGPGSAGTSESGAGTAEGLDGPGGPGTQDGSVLPDATGAVPGGSATETAEPAAGSTAQVLAMLEHQILATVIQIVSGPSGVASFLRRQLLGKGLNGPSLPLDVGQTDDIPVHLRRLVALRDQTCQFSGGCDQPTSRCEPHHVVHRADGGHTSLWNLKDKCHWHHHVLLHQKGWQLTVYPDGTSQVTSPAGKVIRSHSPPPRSG
ncbi:MAG TPA: DUF222 domain-containing protein [Streptosporangiaceae bacterium]|nr:DUF222 domain-containing protein [Streptosporangiaceae bacterium]